MTSVNVEAFVKLSNRHPGPELSLLHLSYSKTRELHKAGGSRGLQTLLMKHYLDRPGMTSVNVEAFVKLSNRHPGPELSLLHLSYRYYR